MRLFTSVTRAKGGFIIPLFSRIFLSTAAGMNAAKFSVGNRNIRVTRIVAGNVDRAYSHVSILVYLTSNEQRTILSGIGVPPSNVVERHLDLKMSPDDSLSWYYEFRASAAGERLYVNIYYEVLS